MLIPSRNLWNTGGEIAIWVSTDSGATWTKVKQLTHGSNGIMVTCADQRPPRFYGFWADGDVLGRRRTVACTSPIRDGTHIWRLPSVMTESTATPQIAW